MVTSKIRVILRDREFDSWCSLKHKGRGVVLYKEFTPGNKWISHHEGLSSSEWKEGLKMVCNVAAVRSVPGRSQDDSRCRRCLSEFETLPHVLGFCTHGEALRNIRHHAIRAILAESLREKGFVVHEEVHGLASQGGTRRIDIIAFMRGSSKGYILDPTVRFETHAQQPLEVNEEKRAIYVPTTPYYKSKYHLNDIEVIGLMVGARGTIPSFFAKTCRKLGINNQTLVKIANTALKGSVHILKNHLYSS